jgi:hypothetical protein
MQALSYNKQFKLMLEFKVTSLGEPKLITLQRSQRGLFH